MSGESKMLPHQTQGLRAHVEVVAVRAEEVLAFALATGDENPRFVDVSHTDFAAPPVFTARYFNPLYSKVLSAAGADFTRLVFGEMDYRYHRSIRVGARVLAEAQVTDLEEKESGQLLRVQVRATDAGGDLLVEGVASFFVRARRKKGEPKKKTPPMEVEGRDEVFALELKTHEEQPALFAKAANDPNPIHLYEGVAQAAGLGGVIMHGLCVMACCGRAVLSELCENDPEQLVRLAVRFSKPAHPGKALTMRVFSPQITDTSKRFTFIAENDAGQPVITDGVAETRVRAVRRSLDARP
ncbi:MAG: MaoC family dehydratase N-terminal domain-containing protein [Deltaproteobacteria bacterium]|nr:MaoC family dehydratase N-terminal domain-containing protein [Deltaproteobacteria bacterium]